MSDSERMDWLLAEQCAPVLLGLKQANLVTLTKSRFRDARQAIASCSDELMDYEMSVSIMKESMRCYTVLIYRRESLAQMLENRDIRLFLEKNGYASTWSLEQCLDELRKRFGCVDHDVRAFPHEVGIFLGYPLRDVVAYMADMNARPVAVGAWKAYSHKEDADRLFAIYRDARASMLARMREGIALFKQIAEAAVAA